MNRKVFTAVLLTVVILCALLTASHAIYAVYAFEHSSIIQFISKEPW